MNGEPETVRRFFVLAGARSVLNAFEAFQEVVGLGDGGLHRHDQGIHIGFHLHGFAPQ